MAGTPKLESGHPQRERAYAREGSKFPQMLTKLAEADSFLRIFRSGVTNLEVSHCDESVDVKSLLRCKAGNYTMQRPKIIEN